MSILGIFIIIALLVFLLISYQGNWAPPALIRGAIAACVIVLVAWLLLTVLGVGGARL